ncbi:MAG: TldD/PmbA family protein [Pseudomonadales bacterium]|nr:TldD/PmbA family protein [Pseudomonadales bacterium]
MNVQNLAENILADVAKQGATGDLIVDEGQSLSLKARQGELEEYKVSSSQVFGLRVIKDGRVGTAYSEASDPDALKSMLDQALLNASFVAVENHEKILPNSAKLKTDDALLCPEENTTIDEKISMILDLEKSLAAKDKVKNVPYNGVQDVTGQRHVFSSAGLTAKSKGRMCSSYAYALIEDGEHNAMEGVGQAARLFSDLDAEAIVALTYENCMGILKGTPVPAKHYDVIFDDETQVSIFDVFSMMFSGKSAKEGVNPLRDKLGSLVADPRLNIFDQPACLDGFGYTLFDAEGTSTKKTPLIVKGRLETLLHNSVTASYFDVASTGHASRGPKSTLGVGIHQMEIAKGTDDEKSLQSGEYLEITGLTGLHSGANAISGNFSFGASGYLCQNGERIQAVRGITVAGNFYEMLKNISMIGDQQTWNWQKSSLMPRIRFADVAVSG